MEEKFKVLEMVNETEILGKKIKMYGSVGFPYFLASDVADWIDYAYANSKKSSRQTGKMIETVDDIEKTLAILGSNNLTPQENKHGGLRGNTEMWFVTEDGLYEVCMQSRKPVAKQMKKEIKQYLKQIRMTGGAIETNREEEFIDIYFPSFTEETKLSMVQDLRKQNEDCKKRISDLEPKAQAYVDLMTAKGYLQFIDVSAMVEIGRNTLFQFLRKCKVLTKQSNYNIPYGRFSKNGMFKVVTSTSENGHVSSVTMVSPKGLNYIYQLIKKKNELDNFNIDTLMDKIKELEAA